MTLLVALLGLLACQGTPFPAPIVGSTYRIDQDVKEPESEILLNVFTTGDECANNKIDEVELCRPMVDRAAGELHLSFQALDPASEQMLPLAIGTEQVAVSHNRYRQPDYEVIPHNPRSAGQLYIVLIDGSGSMWDEGGRRINQVHKALRSKEVVDAFYPDADAQTGVVLMRFTKTLEPLDGQAVRVIRDKEDYRKQVREHVLVQTGGFTHLYDAAKVGMTDLLKDKAILDFLQTRQGQATVILLTDGFNNEEGSDTCGTNAPRLKSALDVLKTARTQGGTARPVMYTVGLGKRYRQGDKPEGLNKPPTPDNLCGSRYADEIINGYVEKLGIDHVSLAWLAEAGGGLSFVKQNYKGLADVFVRAAAKRYEWFEVRYKVPDAIFHRQGFDVRISLTQGWRASTTVRVHPNPWMDAPTATLPPGERWSVITPLRHTLTVLMPVLGILVFLNFLGAAWFNAYRAVFRRARPRRRS